VIILFQLLTGSVWYSFQKTIGVAGNPVDEKSGKKSLKITEILLINSIKKFKQRSTKKNSQL
jgi:hypothetical protein